MYLISIDGVRDDEIYFGFHCSSHFAIENNQYIVECKYDEDFNDVSFLPRTREDATIKCSKSLFPESSRHPRVS